MFNGSSIFILSGGTHAGKVFRIEVDAATQTAICSIFSNAKDKLIENKECIDFDGSYKPNDDEILSIKNFSISEEIIDSIRNPLGVSPFQCIGDDFPEIKSIFVGECIIKNNIEQFNIAFQCFKKEQYLSRNKFNLFFRNDTFFMQESFGLSVYDTIDCYYTNSELQFISFFKARQIFSLGEYYRIATDKELESFTRNANIVFEDINFFESIADTWIRRKIAMINDSNILHNYSASYISESASELNIDISIDNDKIVMPRNKKDIKIILGFLDEEAYKGPFSHNTYIANSKRQVSR